MRLQRDWPVSSDWLLPRVTAQWLTSVTTSVVSCSQQNSFQACHHNIIKHSIQTLLNICLLTFIIIEHSYPWLFWPTLVCPYSIQHYSFGSRSFRFSVLPIWNLFPLEMRSSPTIDTLLVLPLPRLLRSSSPPGIHDVLQVNSNLDLVIVMKARRSCVIFSIKCTIRELFMSLCYYVWFQLICQ